MTRFGQPNGFPYREETEVLRRGRRIFVSPDAADNQQAQKRRSAAPPDARVPHTSSFKQKILGDRRKDILSPRQGAGHNKNVRAERLVPRLFLDHEASASPAASNAGTKPSSQKTV